MAAAPRVMPAVIEIWGACSMARYELADTKDWSILYDTVLEIKTKDDGTHYYPIDELLKWVVR